MGGNASKATFETDSKEITRGKRLIAKGEGRDVRLGSTTEVTNHDSDVR
jgi:hypothetical protein